MFQCSLCNCDFPSNQDYENHLDGKNCLNVAKKKFESVPVDECNDNMEVETVELSHDEIMEKLKTTVNEYVSKFLKKTSSPNGVYFQCQLCSHNSSQKKMVLHHFLTFHSDHYASKEINQKMDQMKVLLMEKEKIVKKQHEENERKKSFPIVKESAENSDIEVLKNIPVISIGGFCEAEFKCLVCSKTMKKADYLKHLKICEVAKHRWSDEKTKKCENCNFHVAKHFYPKHVEFCQRYTNYIFQDVTNYVCKICSMKFPLPKDHVNRIQMQEEVLEASSLFKINLHIKGSFFSKGFEQISTFPIYHQFFL